MRGVFITYTPNCTDATGVGKKIRSQIEVFNNAGLNCCEVTVENNKSKFLRYFYRFPFYNGATKWKYSNQFNDIDYVYMRRPMVMTGYMIKTLKLIKKNNKKIKILMEIPTYPYDEELRGFKFSSLLIYRDRFNRRRLQKSVNKLVTLTDDKVIFDVPTIKIKNGVKVDDIKIKEDFSSKDQSINICAVAIFKEWHGYERILYGLSNYYKQGGKRKINFHFVGDGTETQTYKNIVKNESLENYVKFHGLLDGKDLDDIYNVCDLSFGSFGMYKKGIDISCDLKSREAVARGIPMVVGSKVDIFFENDFPYYLEFPNLEEIVDINKIITFHEELFGKENREDIINNIRDFAKQNVDIKIGMKDVVEYIKQEDI